MKVYSVNRARKPIPSAGVEVGDTYYWWKFRKGGKRVSKTRPTRQQLTQSDFLITVYDLEDELGNIRDDIDREELEEVVDDLVNRIRECAEEQQDKLYNMPDPLQSGPIGQLLEERADSMNSWADELGSVELSDDDAVDQVKGATYPG